MNKRSKGREDRKQKKARIKKTKDQFAFSSEPSPNMNPIINYPILAPKLPQPSTIPETVPI